MGSLRYDPRSCLMKPGRRVSVTTKSTSIGSGTPSLGRWIGFFCHFVVLKANIRLRLLILVWHSSPYHLWMSCAIDLPISWLGPFHLINPLSVRLGNLIVFFCAESVKVLIFFSAFVLHNVYFTRTKIVAWLCIVCLFCLSIGFWWTLLSLVRSHHGS